MEDQQIVALFWQRDENAVAETAQKYGRYCTAIARAVLHSSEDAEECVNDTYCAAWNAIPPNRPELLSAFLGKITRRIALKKLRDHTAAKRGGGEATLILDELEACIPSGETPEEKLETAELTERINVFLAALPQTERRVFLRRYWYFDPVHAIAERSGYTESKVKMMLKRTRDKLMVQLQKEGLLS